MAEPFIRQAGGKRQLAPRILELMPPPEAYSAYVEPFLGGGAVFFHLWNLRRLDGKDVFLGDADKDLHALYKAIRDDVASVDNGCRALVGACIRSGDARAFYLQQRALWNAGDRTPARHLFLRRNAFNGLWRQNKKGEMNTPWKKAQATSPGMELYRALSALHGTELLDWDFRQYEEDPSFFIGPRTLVYLDPPYLPARSTGFTKYLPTDWTERDLVDLLGLARTWHDRRAYVVLSHADTPKFRALREAHWPAAEEHQVMARRAINSDGEGRGPVPELVVVGRA